MDNISYFKVSNCFLSKVGTIAVAIMVMSIPFVTHAATISQQLEFGMSGSDVSTLQTFLAQDHDIYPQGLVTGYFGSLTKAAVSNFQARNEIPVVGRVGPITLLAINMQLGGGMSNTGADVYAPTISNTKVNTNGNSAIVSWNTNEVARGVVYYSTSPLTMYETLHAVNVTGGASAMTDMSFRTSQNVVLSGLQSNTIYYYLVYVTDQMGNVSITLPTTFRSI
jgi:hypothetical protein